MKKKKKKKKEMKININIIFLLPQLPWHCINELYFLENNESIMND